MVLRLPARQSSSAPASPGSGWPRRRRRNYAARGPRTPSRRSTRELPNIGAATARDLTASPEAALRTAGLLMWFWNRCSLLEGSRLLERCLAAAPHAPARDIARARVAYASQSVTSRPCT